MQNIQIRLVFISLIFIVIILISPQKVFAVPKPVIDPAPVPEPQSTREPHREERHSTPAPAPEPQKEERDTKVELQNEPIRIGDDCFSTECGGGTEFNFCDSALPPGFFGPGSDPFTGTVSLGGTPLETAPPGGTPAGGADTVVRRSVPPPGPSPDPVPIELVALSLVSVQPITVTHDSTGEQALESLK